MFADQVDDRFRRYRAAAMRASRDVRIQGLALDLAGIGADGPDDAVNMPFRARRLEQARRLLRGVQERVRYVPQESFVPPVATWELGAGDCKSSAALLCALALACGCPARLVSMGFRGNPSHSSVQLSPFDGSPWLWAEPSILGARLGEHPSAALHRLGGARRSDLLDTSRAAVGDASIGAAGAPAGVHASARDTVIKAFEEELGRKPGLFARQIIQAIAYGETSYGRGWNAPCQNSHNWGGVQAREGQPSCAYTDSFPDGTRYNQPFRVYPDDVAGARDVVKLLYRNMADVGRLLDRAAGVDAVSEAMFYDHYYGASCPNALAKYGAAAKESYAFPSFGKRATTDAGRACERECIGQHQAVLYKNACLIADALGEPRPRKGRNYVPVALVVGGAALLAAGLYFDRDDTSSSSSSSSLPFSLDEVIAP